MTWPCGSARGWSLRGSRSAGSATRGTLGSTARNPSHTASAADLAAEAADNGLPPVGFLNPTLYGLALNAKTYKQILHDPVDGKSGDYRTVKGFDLVTGLGRVQLGVQRPAGRLDSEGDARLAVRDDDAGERRGVERQLHGETPGGGFHGPRCLGSFAGGSVVLRERAPVTALAPVRDG